MIVNFSHEDIVIPKATVVGVAEEISSCVVAAMIIMTAELRPVAKVLIKRVGL
jgi:hypothetical protein